MSTSPEHLPSWARPLGLQPHPEGGWFAETYRSTVVLQPDALPGGYPGARSSATSMPCSRRVTRRWCSSSGWPRA